MRTYRHHALLLVVVTSWVAASAAAGDERSLNASYPASGIRQVAIKAGAGDITIVASLNPTVAVDVSLTPRRGGIFASLVQAEQEVDKATLESTTSDHVLTLTVTPTGKDRRFEEDWTVHMPPDLAVALKLGVGNVTIQGLGGGMDLDVGVGDTTVTAPAGDVHLKLGVGDADLTAPAAMYGPVKASGGIGDATILVNGRSIQGKGMMGRTVSWTGQGPHTLKVEVGVGDAQVTLK